MTFLSNIKYERHVAESRAELELLTEGTGPIALPQFLPAAALEKNRFNGRLPGVEKFCQ